jgi:polyhydroxyalkanoate synthase subunit PhaE
MADPDHLKALFDFWAKGGTSVAAAQEKMFKDFADQMGKGYMLPMAAFTPGNADFQKATEALREVMLSSLQLPGSVVRPHGPGESGDGVTVELLQKIFDPREWLSATGYMDETVRRITEGPKLADLWQVEGKFLAVMRAWMETRTHSVEHTTHVLAAWAKAASEFAGKLQEAANKGRPLGSRAEVVGIWVDIANRHLLEAQRSQAFLETQRKLLQASSDLKLAQQELGDYYGEMFGLPTRVEIDDLARSVAELKREFRADKRRQRNPPKRPAKKARKRA